MTAGELYDLDFVEWTRRNAALLREGRVGEADLAHIAEEIEDLGKSRQRALQSALMQLLMHVLKYEWQPVKRSRSWLISIGKQQKRVHRILRENPSLKGKLPEILIEAYGDARDDAAIETGLPISRFPVECPIALEQILNEDLIALLEKRNG